jgi:SAM-dependent methyltransferase
MQSKEEIEAHYAAKVDPWDYYNNPDDANRKAIILDRLEKYGPYVKALDLGCGEGFITKDLPALKLYGYELSDTAAARFPKNVERVITPEGGYDLVVATGVFYRHYDWQKFLRLVKRHASAIFLTSNIKAWEIPELNEFNKKLVHEETFPYREYEQHLRIFDFGR